MNQPGGAVPTLLGVAALVAVTVSVLSLYRVPGRSAPAWAMAGLPSRAGGIPRGVSLPGGR